MGIKESMKRLGITHEKLKRGEKYEVADTNNILTEAEAYLGSEYKEVSPGVFLSKDGERKVRMTARDLARGHVHFETTRGVNGGRQGKNYHIGYRD